MIRPYPSKFFETMAEPTLTGVFGAGATQTATHITIAKADLDLTASATNRAEQLLAGIVKRAGTTLTPTAFGADLDVSVNVSPGYDSLITRSVGGTTAQYYQSQVVINFAKPQASAGITPNDY